MGLIEKFLELDKPKDDNKEVMSGKEKKETKFHVRTLGSAIVSAETQRIYNPNLPPTKAPTQAQQDTGTTAGLDTSGNWGKPDVES